MTNMNLFGKLNYLSAELGISDGVAVLFSILILCVLVGLSLYLYYLIKRNKKYVLSRANEKKLMPADEFATMIDILAEKPEKKLKYNLYRIDICNFDALKKTLGDDSCEDLLKEITSRLLKIEPWGVHVGLRAEGSLFVLVHFDETQTPEIVCQLILKVLGKSFTFGKDLNVNLIIDVASVAFPKFGKNFDKLNECLEIAIINAHRQGENKFVIYTSQFKNENTTEYKFYQAIRNAVKDKEFFLHYQPVVETNSYEVVGGESFIRWMNKEKGMLNPAEFLAVMEQTGDIYWAGLWCFEQMLVQYMTWQTNYNKKLFASINLSIVQLKNPNLFEDLRKVLRKYNFDPTQIMLEIEDLGMYDTSLHVKENLDRLSALGINICLDNFGSKFSDATNLQNYPLNTIKITSKFWRNAKTNMVIENMVKLIVDYGRENNILIVANGVETEEEIKYLRNFGVNYMQGYAFIKSKPADEFIQSVLLKPWVTALKPTKKKSDKKD